jgi:hypothetical protein
MDGNGRTYTPLLAEAPPLARGVEAYATHRPSGENTAPIGCADRTAQKGAAFLSASDNASSE